MNRWLPLFLLALFLGCFGPNAGARYYDPESGTFLSPDPLGHAASMSLYDYCNGDPVNGLDPDGRCSWSGQANTQANSLLSSYGQTASNISLQPMSYTTPSDSVNYVDSFYGPTSEQKSMNGLVNSIPGLNMFSAMYSAATGRAAFTGQWLSNSDINGLMVSSILETGLSVAGGMGGMAESTLAGEGEAVMVNEASAVTRSSVLRSPYVPAAESSVVDKSWKALIEGTAQKTGTPGHQFRTYRG